MPKPDTALVYGMRPLKDVVAQHFQATPGGFSMPIFNTANNRACSLEIRPHDSPVYVRFDAVATAEHGAYVTTLGKEVTILLAPEANSMNRHFVHVISEANTTVTLNWGIIAP